MSKYARKKDGNQKEIEQTLTDARIPWIDTSRLGNGFPDLIALPFNTWHLLEVKVRGEKLTPAEQVFHERFQGAPLHIVYSGDHALFCMGVIDQYDAAAAKTRTPRQTSQKAPGRIEHTKNVQRMRQGESIQE